MVLLARRFSITNFLIATSALGFQVFVLYPWHQELDIEFKHVRQELNDLRREREAQNQEDRKRWESVLAALESTKK